MQDFACIRISLHLPFPNHSTSPVSPASLHLSLRRMLFSEEHMKSSWVEPSLGADVTLSCHKERYDTYLQLRSIRTGFDRLACVTSTPLQLDCCCFFCVFFFSTRLLTWNTISPDFYSITLSSRLTRHW